MNKLPATIVNIESAEHISLVDLQTGSQMFSCVVIETPETAGYLRVGKAVHILFKETEVSIARNLSGQLSLRNQIAGVIKQLDQGQVLTKITLSCEDFEIASVITTRSVRLLGLKEGEQVTALIKANEVSILEGEQLGI